MLQAKTRYGTAFVESELFLAILEDDTEYARENLREFSSHALRRMSDKLGNLEILIGNLLRERREADTLEATKNDNTA